MSPSDDGIKFVPMCHIEQNKLDFDVILGRGNFMKTGQKEFQEASLNDVKKEMAMPRMAQSARQAGRQAGSIPAES